MDRLFLDANVLFSAAHKTDTRLLQLWKLKDVALFSSGHAVQEARINLPHEDQRTRLNKLTVLLDLVDTSHGTLPRGITLPEKDVPILLAAIEARCTYLLTGDGRHFGPYLGKKIGGIQIALPAQYLRLRDAID
jgi:uncharacterized protein